MCAAVQECPVRPDLRHHCAQGNRQKERWEMSNLRNEVPVNGGLHTLDSLKGKKVEVVGNLLRVGG